MTDGLSVFLQDLPPILIFFISVSGIGLLVTRSMAGDEVSYKKRLLLAASIGCIGLGLSAFVLMVIGHVQPVLIRPGSLLIVVISAVVVVIEFWRALRSFKTSWRDFAFMSMAVGVLLIIRLAFLKHILLPPYSDSPIHYQIIQGFLHPTGGNLLSFSLENMTEHYYHYGFHSLAAWFTSASGRDAIVIIPLLGQLFLVIAPLSVLSLTLKITNNISAALFAAFLSAVGWSMPAFAANWGKYPAMAALAVLPALLAGLYDGWHDRVNPWRFYFWGTLLVIGITFLHTRTVILVALSLVSFYVARRIVIDGEISFTQGFRLALFYLIALAPAYSLLAEFYGQSLTLILLIAVLPLSFQYFPRLSIGIFIFTFFVEMITLVPKFSSEVLPTILNEQFVEMMLYIPLSILGGAGLAGVLEKIQRSRSLQQVGVAAVLGVVLVNFITGPSVIPDPCCSYFKGSDQLAMNWIQAHASEKSLFLISVFREDHQSFGSDAGVWITPLTGFHTNKLDFDIKWQETNDLEQSCLAGAREIYIYMGGEEFSFEYLQLVLADWVEPVFSSGKTVIYRVSSCLS